MVDETADSAGGCTTDNLQQKEINLPSGNARSTRAFFSFALRHVNPSLLMFPLLMASQQQGFDGFVVGASLQLLVPHTAANVGRRIFVSMSCVTTDLTKERLLI